LERFKLWLVWMKGSTDSSVNPPEGFPSEWQRRLAAR